MTNRENVKEVLETFYDDILEGKQNPAFRRTEQKWLLDLLIAEKATIYRRPAAPEKQEEKAVEYAN